MQRRGSDFKIPELRQDPSTRLLSIHTVSGRNGAGPRDNPPSSQNGCRLAGAWIETEDIPSAWLRTPRLITKLPVRRRHRTSAFICFFVFDARIVLGSTRPESSSPWNQRTRSWVGSTKHPTANYDLVKSTSTLPATNPPVAPPLPQCQGQWTTPGALAEANKDGCQLTSTAPRTVLPHSGSEGLASLITHGTILITGLRKKGRWGG